MAFANPNLTFKLTDGSKHHVFGYPLQNPRNISLLSSSSSSTMRSCSYIHTTHELGINYRKICRIQPQSSPKFVVRCSTNGSISRAPSNSNSRIVFWSGVTLVLAIGNRVLYKLALVPMKEHPFFLAQVNTFGYVAIYFSILYMRRRAGIVTNEMLSLPKWRFAVIGMLEALGVVAGMYSAAKLPGPAIPILNQMFLLWQLVFSALVLGRRYSWNKIAGCLLVAAGVVTAIAGGSESGQMLSGVGLTWPIMMVASTAFQAGATIIKEYVFIDAVARLKGKFLDIFVVNSFGSGFEALFVLMFLPFLSNLKGIPFHELPSYIKSGAGCFLNVGLSSSGCDGSPLLPLLYLVNNIAFNISTLNLVRISSAVVSSLAVVLSVPTTIYILSLPLPYLPEGVTLSPFFLFGSVILVLGLVLYIIPLHTNTKKKQGPDPNHNEPSFISKLPESDQSEQEIQESLLDSNIM